MPNDLIAAGRITKDRQIALIGSVEIPGVQSINSSYQFNSEPLRYIGMTGAVQLVPQGAKNGTFNISALMVADDNFISLTGGGGVNGFILKNRGEQSENFSFTSGYLTYYGSKCSIGQIPESNATFSVFGNIGKLPVTENNDVVTSLAIIETGNASGLLQVVDPGSISISISDFTTNRVQSYDLSINIPRKPIYILGTGNPYRVEINYPVEILASFDIEVNDYGFRKLSDFPFAPKSGNLSITFKDLHTLQTIRTYNFANMFLLSESYSAGINGPVTATIGYRAFVNR